MEDNAVVDGYINREYKKDQVERVKYGRLYTPDKRGSTVNIWIPEGYCPLSQCMKTKISPVKELMADIGILITQYVIICGNNNVVEICQGEEEQGEYRKPVGF
jgi:hypothetical protein